MSKRKERPTHLEVGMEVTRIPESIFGTDANGKSQRQPMRGCVTYIHPLGRFHTVEFQTRGGPIRESFLGVEV